MVQFMPQWLKHPFSIALTRTVTLSYCILLLGHFFNPHKHYKYLCGFSIVQMHRVTQTYLSPGWFPHAFSRFSNVHFHDFIHNLKVHPISTCQPALLFSFKSQILLFLCCNAYTTPDKTVVTRTD